MQLEQTVFIALGSNLGNRESYLHFGRLALIEVITVQKISAIYETPPWGVLDQPEYLNQVIQGCTTLSPTELLKFLKVKEQTAGRVEGMRYGPRVLDMDILFYGQEIVEMDELQIPHPRLQERAFVLVPLEEIAPHWVHPVSGLSVRQILLNCPNREDIHLYEAPN